MFRSMGRARARAGMVLAPVLTVLVLLSGCGSSVSKSAGGGGKTVTLGMVTALQGDLADLGTGFLNGAQLAVTQINQQRYLGDGETVRLKTVEGSEDPQKSISAFNQLVTDSSVSAVYAAITSPVGGAIKPLAIANKIPLVIQAATLPGLNEPPYIYRTYQLPSTYAPRLSQSVIDAYHPKSVAYALTSDNDGMVTLLKAVRKPYDDAGVKDDGTVDILSTQTDMHGPAVSLVSKNPDVIQLQMAGNNAGTLVSDIRSLGYKGEIVGCAQTATLGTLTASGGALVGVPFPIDYMPVSNVPMAKQFTAAYEATYHKVPDAWAAAGYTGIYLAATGVKNAIAGGHEVTRASVSKGLASITTFPSVYGDTYMKDGQITSDAPGIFGTWSADNKQVLWKP